MKKKIVSLILTVVMLVSAFPITAFGASYSIAEGYYYIASCVGSDCYLNVANSTMGANTQIGNSKQPFYVLKDTNGYYKIETVDSSGSRTGIYLDVDANILKYGRNVATWGPTDANGQRWEIVSRGNGVYNINVKGTCTDTSGKNAGTGRLDVKDGKTAAGTNVILWSTNNDTAQQWKFETITFTNTLSYNANGGSNAPASQSSTVTFPNTSNSFTVNTTTIPKKLGYIFKGWAESSTSTTKVSSTVTVGSNNKLSNQSKTLYAIWEKCVNHSFTGATVDVAGICSKCGETGSKLPSMKVSYLDPITNETVDLGEATNDNVSTAITNLMKTPMQKQDNIFLGWYDSKEKAINKNATRFDTLTNIKANFLGIGYMDKDINDEKNIPYYKTFGLAGVQIRQDNTVELETDEHDTAVYGGLRYVASLSDDIYNNLDIIEYGFVVATRENADANAVASGDEANYVIKNGDKNVKRINCATSVDHRRFDGNYRLFTMVIDYEGNEALKSTDFVARAYIAYRDANGVARIFYNDYDGTNVYGGCSVSYNRALALM